MIEQILWAQALANLTAAVHVVGAVRIVLPWGSRRRMLNGYRQAALAVLLLVRPVGGLLDLYVIELAWWAAAFRLAGVFDGCETAMYYSLKSYTTVG